MSTKRRWLLSIIVCIPAALGLLHSGAAGAASDAGNADSTSGAPDTTSLEEVVVTARKSAERLLDVPAEVIVLDQAALARYGTTNLNDLSTQIPTLALNRGFGGSDATL